MLPLHIISFGLVIGVSAIADKDALAWMRGRVDVLQGKTVRQYHAMIWIGLIALIVSGTMLLYPSRISLLSDLLFDIKLLFVGILIVNAFLIGRLTEHAVTMPYRAVPAREKRALFLSGAISVMAWVAAAGIAFLLFE